MVWYDMVRYYYSPFFTHNDDETNPFSLHATRDIATDCAFPLWSSALPGGQLVSWAHMRIWTWHLDGLSGCYTANVISSCADDSLVKCCSQQHRSTGVSRSLFWHMTGRGSLHDVIALQPPKYLYGEQRLWLAGAPSNSCTHGFLSRASHTLLLHLRCRSGSRSTTSLYWRLAPVYFKIDRWKQPRKKTAHIDISPANSGYLRCSLRQIWYFDIKVSVVTGH